MIPYIFVWQYIAVADSRRLGRSSTTLLGKLYLLSLFLFLLINTVVFMMILIDDESYSGFPMKRTLPYIPFMHI